jgi:argininosuccinate lyase
VEDVNRLVQQGVPFRDAYVQVGKRIEAGGYQPDKRVQHTHAGSLGNLCLPEIQKKMDEVIGSFNFKTMDLAIEKLLK